MKYKSIGNSWQYGSIGGCTYSKNRFGAFVRNRAIPTNPQSGFQSAVRNYFAGLASDWRNTLTPTQRASWDDYALLTPKTKYGEQYTPLGINWFVAINSLRLLGSFAQLNTAPTTGGGTLLTAPTITPEAPDVLNVSFTNTDEWATAVGGHLFVFGGRAVPGSNNAYRSSFRYVDTIDGAVVPPTSPAILTNPFTWPADATLRTFTRFIAMAPDGRLSIPTTATALIIP